MRPWLILAACILASFPSLADDHGVAPAQVIPAQKVEPPTLAPIPASAEATAPVDPNIVTDATYAPDSFKDTQGAPLKPTRDEKEENPPCFTHADYLRDHHDLVLAADYLKQIATNGTLSSQDRSRAMIQLADVLELRGQNAEALCWLKMWCELFPGRREFSGVSYRLASLYSQLGMTDLARDAYYLSLGHAVNQGQILGHDDLANYNKLTTATLWGLAANEYEAGQWQRAADLFDRYRREATAATPASVEKSEYLQADCYYQLKQADNAIKLYTDTLAKHPFNPLAPQGRLRLYHLYMVKNEPGKAQAELQSLIWTVRTVWPKDEAYWQQQTAQLLLGINQKNADVLPPLMKEAALVPPQGKTWQETLNHYDALVSYQVVKTGGVAGRRTDAFSKVGDKNSLEEQNDLLVMNTRLNQVLPPATPGTNP